jgi:hypothetical protein
MLHRKYLGLVRLVPEFQLFPVWTDSSNIRENSLLKNCGQIFPISRRMIEMYLEAGSDIVNVTETYMLMLILLQS